MILSDGENFLQSMLATNLNYTVTDSQVVKHSIIRVNKFTYNIVQDRRYDAVVVIYFPWLIYTKINDYYGFSNSS